jgi:hypothetical protein
MDPDRFDALVESIHSGISRRATRRHLGALAVFITVGLGTAPETAAHHKRRHRCPAATPHRCNGVCQQCCDDAQCLSGEACCSGGCTKLATDVAHCGSCDVTCPTDKTCVGGTCCTPRGGICSGGGECCGTDICREISGTNGAADSCQACLKPGEPCGVSASGAIFDANEGCCPGLFCIYETSPLVQKACVTCLPEGEYCEDNSQCCTGLYCKVTSTGSVCASPSAPG